MLTLIESRSKAWAMTATNGAVRVFSREQAGEWSEVLLSDESEHLDEDASLILEALYEQYAGAEPDQSDDVEEPAAEEAEEPEAEDDDDLESEEGEEPEAEEDTDGEIEEGDKPEAKQKPRRSRRRTRARRK